MKMIRPNTLLKGPLSLSIAVLIACCALLIAFTADRDSLPALACAAFWEIEHQDVCGDIIIPEAGIEIASEQPLGNLLIEQFTASILINEQHRVSKVLGMQPGCNEQLAATISFQYHKQDIGDLPEDQLIRHSSQDDERPWQTHYNNIVGSENNSIHSSGIGYSSLWTTAPTGTLLFQQSTFSLNSNRL
jgi:hypothetical protein